MFTAKDYVYEVYREKSFTLAAKKLFVSQPALSASIKKTEKEIGAELFDRHSSPIRLTEAGKAYVDAIEQIYAIEENLKNKISDINNLKSGSVTVGGASFISSYLIPEIINEYKASFPGITLNVIESNSEALKEQALTGIIDAVIDYDFDETVFKSYPLKNEKIFLATAKSSSFAKKFTDLAMTGSEIRKGHASKKPAIDTKLLNGEKFIMLKRGNDMFNHATRIFKEAGIQPDVIIQLDQVMTSFNVCLKGLGVAFVTDTLIKTADTQNAVFFRLDSPFATRTLWLAHRRSMDVTGSLTKLISTAQTVCKNI